MSHTSGPDRSQTLLLPDSLDEYVGPNNLVRFVDAFVDGLEGRLVLALLEIDVALTTAETDPAWLHKRSKAKLRSPPDLMRVGASNDVLRSLTQTVMRASLRRR